MSTIKKTTVFTFLIILMLVSFTACATEQADESVSSSTEIVTDVPVMAEGIILPKEDSSLAFTTAGKIEAILVQAGESVQTGDVLMRLAGSEPLEAELESLNYNLLMAQQALDDLQSQADYDREQTSLQVIEAQAVLYEAQDAYDEFDMDRYEDDLDALDEDIIDAEHDVEDAKDELADYEDLDEENTTREKYQDALDDAEDKLEDLQRERTDLINEYDQLLSTLNSAQAQYDITQEELEKRQNGPDSDQLAALNAQIDSIQASIDAAYYQLDQLELTAGMTGIVMEVLPTVNDVVSAGQTVVIIANTSEWMVETDDLNELEIIEITEGQTVQIEVEAFPDEILSGIVTEINDMPEFNQGDVLYTVTIEFTDRELPDVKWGMTVNVTFE